MRRRWKWPILENIASTEPETWACAWLIWLGVGFFLLVIPALFVDTDRYDDVYVGTFLIVALIVWLAPLLLGALIVLASAVRWLVGEYGHRLLPRRVTEPEREDLRHVARRGEH